jgi:hypothetical protein
MQRRTFLGAAGALALVPAPTIAATPGDEAAVKKFIVDWYRAFGNPRVDRTFYRSFMSDDYMLLENGVLMNKEGDVGLLDSTPLDRQRSDTFDFRRVVVEGNSAYLVYFLTSETTDSKDGRRTQRFLESALLRRDRGKWRALVLHSTRITPVTKP